MPGVDGVTVLHIHFADRAGEVRSGILGLDRLRIALLRLCIAVLRLALAGGGIGRIQRIEQLALFHQVSFLKGIAEDFSGHQSGNRVGVCRLQRAAGAEGIDDIPLRYGLFLITGNGGGCLQLGQQPHRHRAAGHCNDHQQQQPAFFLSTQSLQGIAQFQPAFFRRFFHPIIGLWFQQLFVHRSQFLSVGVFPESTLSITEEAKMDLKERGGFAPFP